MDYNDEKMSRVEATAFLGCPPNCLGQLARAGKGPRYIRFSRKIIRYLKADLIAWRDSQVVEPVTKSP